MESQSRWLEGAETRGFGPSARFVAGDRASFLVSDRTPGAVPRILVIDPDPETHAAARDALGGRGCEILSTVDVEEAIRLIELHGDEAEALSAIYCALESPANKGLRVFTRLRRLARGVPVYLLAPREALEAAKAAVQLGAAGYLLKPISAGEMLSPFDPGPDRTALGGAQRVQMRSLPVAPPAVVSDPLGHLVGAGPGMQKVFGLIRKVAPSDVNVLITGESGSGKEMVAAGIHRCSSRAKKPFVAINCAAIPKDLLESELFGHAKGAFTGAHASRRGLFEEAHEGTVLLDEIGDLPLPLQAKILRLLQTKEVRPLGSNTIKEVSVRIVSATHKNLRGLIQKGEFREDLYYRLNVMPIHLPPLRERREDIPILAAHFLKKHSPAVGRRLNGFTAAAIRKLQSLSWKGNVRELENAIERAMVLADESRIDDEDILVDDADAAPGFGQVSDLFNSGMSLKDIEREYIKHVLTRTGNRKEAATRILGIDRKTLYRKEKIYGIRAPQGTPPALN